MIDAVVTGLYLLNLWGPLKDDGASQPRTGALNFSRRPDTSSPGHDRPLLIYWRPFAFIGGYIFREIPARSWLSVVESFRTSTSGRRQIAVGVRFPTIWCWQLV